MHKSEWRVWVAPLDGDDRRSAAETLCQTTKVEAERMRMRLERVGSDVWLEEVIVDFDQNWQVCQLMGSSMGDLEILDIVETYDDGIRRRRHVLRRKAQDNGLPGEPLAEMRYSSNRVEDGEYIWYLTGAGMNFILENCMPREAIAASLSTMIPVV